MTAILQHAELIRFAAMATFLTLTLILARLVTRLGPACRARPQPERRNGAPTRRPLSKRVFRAPAYLAVDKATVRGNQNGSGSALRRL
jgi:hypothetical protein